MRRSLAAAILLLAGCSGAQAAPADREACRAALEAADTVADMLEAVAPNPAAAFDLTFHQLERSGYRELAARCRAQL